MSRRRLAVVARPDHPSTTDLRLAGCRQAAADAGAELVFLSGDPADHHFVAQVIAQSDCVACSNDVTAAALIASLRTLDISVPNKMRVGGFDDAGAAATSLVPLTTIHMPCRELARQAVRTLLERIAEPQLPARQVLLTGRLVVRRSSG